MRELRNLIERVVLLEEGDAIEAEHLPPELLGRRVAATRRDRTIATRSLPTLAQMEADHIGEVLRLTAGNKSRAARILGISRQGLIEKLRRLRIEDGRRSSSLLTPTKEVDTDCQSRIDRNRLAMRRPRNPTSKLTA